MKIINDGHNDLTQLRRLGNYALILDEVIDDALQVSICRFEGNTPILQVKAGIYHAKADGVYRMSYSESWTSKENAEKARVAGNKLFDALSVRTIEQLLN